MTQELSAAKQLEKLQAAIENYRHGRNTLSPSGRLNKYKSEFVKGKKKVKGKWVWWDEKLKKPFDRKSIEQSLYHETIGTTTPLKDIKYLEAKVKHDAKVAQGPDPLRTQLSSKESGTDTTVYESDWKDNLAKSETSLNKLKLGTTYARQEEQESLKKLGTLTKTKVQPQNTQEVISNATGGNSQDQAVANSLYIRNSDDKKGAVPFAIDQFKEYNTDLQYLNRTQDQNVAYNTGEKFDKDATSPTSGAAKEALEELKIRSDVHTIDPKTKKAVGVLTRSQRKAFEARADVRESLFKIQNSGLGIRTYKEGGPQFGG